MLPKILKTATLLQQKEKLMRHKNCRYMVNVNEDISASLQHLAGIRKKSISSLITELIEEALDFEEDVYLSKIADEAWEKCKDGPWIPAEEVYKRCGLI